MRTNVSNHDNHTYRDTSFNITTQQSVRDRSAATISDFRKSKQVESSSLLIDDAKVSCVEIQEAYAGSKEGCILIIPYRNEAITRGGIKYPKEATTPRSKGVPDSKCRNKSSSDESMESDSDDEMDSGTMNGTDQPFIRKSIVLGT